MKTKSKKPAVQLSVKDMLTNLLSKRWNFPMIKDRLENAGHITSTATLCRANAGSRSSAELYIALSKIYPEMMEE